MKLLNVADEAFPQDVAHDVGAPDGVAEDVEDVEDAEAQEAVQAFLALR